MTFTFGEKWVRWQKRLLCPITEIEARRCYEARQLHTVLCHVGSLPSCFLTFNNDFVSVGFLDEFTRDWMEYQFVELEQHQLFLGLVVERTYSGNSGQVAGATFFRFSPNGNVRIEKVDTINKSTDVGEITKDVTANWEPYPEFGKYESIIRLER